jgi:hypothetical protein
VDDRRWSGFHSNPRYAVAAPRPAADQLDDPGHDGDEPVVLLPDLAEELDFVLGHKLQPLASFL